MKRIFQLPKRISNHISHRMLTARNSQHNDFYLVEFPKSGVTWLSTLLANMALLESGRSEIASFTAAHLFVPDIHVVRNIGEMAYSSPPVRMIKSHSQYNPNYLFLVYLVRHPLPLMKSYYRFVKEFGGTEFDTFDSFCRSEEFGIPAWKKHVRSWLIGGVISQRVHVCRYEDLLKNPYNEVELMSKNFGWNIKSSSIEEAVRRSSMDCMKESEALYKSKNPRYKMTFVGGKGDFYISDETRKYIVAECKEEMELLGYNNVNGL